ncbi:mn2+ homeostasis protein [Moniliophthora roreri MCA 2997]|uniref:Post-GPI attachment to proteins factor 3 n=1 Tax=Moniliophthora roreri (strain MCA 2997) TaxID=1381753 RepID=V2WNY8_MONRO|nr:mn2+ homeostasis protein [Moniliophthora roreri MCA 2997]
MKRVTFQLFLIFSLLTIVLGSVGDRSNRFQNCILRCNVSQCNIASPAILPLALRLTRWDCIDNCKYNCMHEITSQSIRKGEQIVQYYGKWPFYRFAGIQEPASVTFSLLNMWAHVRGLSKIRREIPDSHPLKIYFIIWSFASINTWIWSAVFHTRDTPLTEKLDYFSAAFTIVTALYFTAIRIFHLYTPPSHARLTLKNSGRKSAALTFWSLVCCVAYIAHVSYLTFLPRFDYTYNIVFNLVIGMTHNMLWLLYSLPSSLSIIRRFPNRPKTYRPSFVGNAFWLVVLTTAATALELFDFPPWFLVIDAHSLWHLCTAPIAISWYRFLVVDALDESWKDQRL